MQLWLVSLLMFARIIATHHKPSNYMKRYRFVIRLNFFCISFAFIGCSVPDISDQEIHFKGTDHIDTTWFNNDTYHFPDDSWIVYDKPDQLGWDEQKLSHIGHLADSLETAGLMVVHKGVLVYDWGATDEKYITQSMRKGLLNSLYGVYWDRGIINLDATLKDLGIDDEPPLTEMEKSATIEHLLQSTSGIYHSAIYELGEWKREKPERGTHSPGETWYYNNWGFNALGTIFEQRTGASIGDAFYEEIATPLQMQDFTPSDVSYISQNDWSEWFYGNESEHDAYMFSTSTRDMARYGLLYLNNGQWNNQRILSEEWIEKSWEPVNIDMYYTLKFSYMWWLFEEGGIYVNENYGYEGDIYFTSGNRGHFVFVIPYLDLVVVHRVYIEQNDFWSQAKRGVLGIYAEVDDHDVYKMLGLIREAHPKYSN